PSHPRRAGNYVAHLEAVSGDFGATLNLSGRNRPPATNQLRLSESVHRGVHYSFASHRAGFGEYRCLRPLGVVAATALAALLLVAAHAKNDSAGVAGSDGGAEMEDCNCWDDFLEEQPKKQPNQTTPINDD